MYMLTLQPVPSEARVTIQLAVSAASAAALTCRSYLTCWNCLWGCAAFADQQHKQANDAEHEFAHKLHCTHLEKTKKKKSLRW